MKRLLLFLTIGFLTLDGIAQQNPKFSENDIKQFYRTIQGDYISQINDSTRIALHFTPIWERENEPFRWMYMEAVKVETKEVIEQNILEIVANSDISFQINIYGIESPERFAGKWANRNFFDGFNQKVLKGRSSFSFMKTKDYEYQTNWNGPKALRCFPSGDRIHFKFVQEDERLYIKRLPANTTDIIGIVFFKELTD